jgi:hypothetical protein
VVPSPPVSPGWVHLPQALRIFRSSDMRVGAMRCPLTRNESLLINIRMRLWEGRAIQGCASEPEVPEVMGGVRTGMTVSHP